jgi:hypothetical protein
MSYKAQVVKALAKIGQTNGTANPDAKHNVGNLIGEAFLWDEVVKYAEGRSEAAWARLQKEGIVPAKKDMDPGDYEIAYSPTFLVTAKVTQPIKRFDQDELARIFHESKYKVPVSVTKEIVDLAKVPKSSNVIWKIIERGS